MQTLLGEFSHNDGITAYVDKTNISFGLYYIHCLFINTLFFISRSLRLLTLTHVCEWFWMLWICTLKTIGREAIKSVWKWNQQKPRAKESPAPSQVLRFKDISNQFWKNPSSVHPPRISNRFTFPLCGISWRVKSFHFSTKMFTKINVKLSLMTVIIWFLFKIHLKTKVFIGIFCVFADFCFPKLDRFRRSWKFGNGKRLSTQKERKCYSFVNRANNIHYKQIGWIERGWRRVRDRNNRTNW